MLKSYLKVAWRNLFRNRTLSIINLIGLSISVAFCVLLFLHIRYEQSFDSWHVHKDRLYRVEMSSLFDDPRPPARTSLFSFFTTGSDQHNELVFPLVVGPDMQRLFPEVRQVVRFEDHVQQLVRADGQVYKEEQTLYTENSFWTSFSFRLLKGDARTVLTAPGNVVLSASTAKKYFGDRDPIGRTIQLVNDSNRLFKVAGIAEDAPANSSIQYSLILPLQADPDYAVNINERFNHMSHFLVVELAPGTDVTAFRVKLNAWMKNYFLTDVAKGWQLKPQQVANFHWYLRPFADCHYNASQGWGHYTDAKSMYQLFCIVIVILLLASLNYVLITVANAAARVQEVGIRKVIGAGRWGIVVQSWLETQLLVGVAVLLGLGLAYAGVPLLKTVIDSGVTYANISWGDLVLAAACLAVLLGVLAGYYPAMLISRFKPVSAIKSFSTFRVNPRFSKVLVIVQFTCCVVLMMGAFVIDRQMTYVHHKDLGFDKEQVLMVHNPTWDQDFTKRMAGRLSAFAQTQPSILAYTEMAGDLTGKYNLNGFSLNGERHWMRQISVGYGYFEMLGLKIVAGRSFSRDFPTDTVRKARVCVVNETMWKLLGPTARLGVYNDSIRRTILGVVKDYNFESLSQKIEPQVHELVRGWSEFVFKVRAGKMQQTIAALEREWREASNNYPFEYGFLDQSIEQLYAPDMRWEKAMQSACGFAILIACMGLFGLAAINAANRTKEIGIRKVLGADVMELVMLLSAGFLRMVFVSVMIAIPVGWWLMNRWLEDYAYRIDIQWWMFVVVGATALTIALAAVSLHVWRAARANPVEALRAE